MFNYLLQPDRPRWLFILGAFVIPIAAIGSWMQTACFINVWEQPNYEMLRTHIKESQRLQAEVANKAKQANQAIPAGPITYIDLTPEEIARLDNARNFILADKELEAKLQNQFGTSLKDVRAVIAPSWKLNNPGYSEMLGITREGGWPEFDQAQGSDTVGATTIRDRPGKSPRTIDGIPRIILNPNALGNLEWTRLVMFHELLHAMNIPGRKPFVLARMQTDLTYLPEYTWFIQKAGLWDNDYIYWIFTALFAVAFGVSVLAIIKSSHAARDNRLDGASY